MFRYQSAIFRESTTTKEYKSNTPIQVLLASGVFESGSFVLVHSLKMALRCRTRRSWYLP